MWNTYIPNNKGVCIKLNGPAIIRHFSLTKISSSHIRADLSWLRNVNYVSKPLEISWADFVEADPLSAGTTLLYTKLDDFAFEQEWRFAIFDCIKQSIQFSENIVEEVFIAPETTIEQRTLIDEWNKLRKLKYKVTEANISDIFVS